MYEVELGGKGYRVAGGKYRKSAVAGGLGLRSINMGDSEALVGVPPTEGLQPFRRIFWGNWRGLGAPVVAGGWAKAENAGLTADVQNLCPVLDGAALALAPMCARQTVEAVAPDISGYAALTVGTLHILAIGARVYTATGAGNFVYEGNAAGVVRGLGVWNGQIVVGSGGNLQTFDPATGAFGTFAPSVAAEYVTSYGGVLIVISGATVRWLIPAVGTWSAGIGLESSITGLQEYDGGLYIGTATALYRLRGNLRAGAPGSAPNVLNMFDYDLGLLWRTSPANAGFWTEANFSGLAAWRGSLWFWANGKFYRTNPNGRLELQPQPLVGVSRGVALCGGLLVVAAAQPDGSTQLYANDGNFGTDGAGWWRIGATGQLFPFAHAGWLGVLDVNTAGQTVFGRWLHDANSVSGTRADNYGVAREIVDGSVTLPLFSPADLQGSKIEAVQPLRVGVEWMMAGDDPTIDPAELDCLLRISLSRDAGATWTALLVPDVSPGTYRDWYSPGASDFRGSRAQLAVPADFAQVHYPAGRVHDGNPVSDPGWLVRVQWRGNAMPLLRRVWLDYAVAEVTPKTGLMWELDLDLSEPGVRLDGSVGPEDVPARLAALWNIWEAGTTVHFRDTDAVVYEVKIAGIEQRMVATGTYPTYPPGWVAAVKLAEVVFVRS